MPEIVANPKSEEFGYCKKRARKKHISKEYTSNVNTKRRKINLVLVIFKLILLRVNL